MTASGVSFVPATTRNGLLGQGHRARRTRRSSTEVRTAIGRPAPAGVRPSDDAIGTCHAARDGARRSESRMSARASTAAAAPAGRRGCSRAAPGRPARRPDAHLARFGALPERVDADPARRRGRSPRSWRWCVPDRPRSCEASRAAAGRWSSSTPSRENRSARRTSSSCASRLTWCSTGRSSPPGPSVRRDVVVAVADDARAELATVLAAIERAPAGFDQAACRREFHTDS